jgi:preprotein translocase subunit SecD
VLLFVIIAVCVLLGFVIEHRSRPPSPWQGGATIDVALGSDDGDASADADRLVRRLDALGVEAEVLGTSPHEIRLRLHDVSGASMMNDVATPRRLSFHMVAEEQPPLFEPAGTADEARAQITAAALPAGVLARVECEEETEGARRCTPWLLEPDATLTSDDVTDAHVKMDEQSGQPVVMIAFSPAGAQRFADTTAASIHRKLAICVDDDIVSQPVIQSRIDGGTAMITLGSHSYERTQRDADALVAALTTGPLTARWTLLSESQSPR